LRINTLDVNRIRRAKKENLQKTYRKQWGVNLTLKKTHNCEVTPIQWNKQLAKRIVELLVADTRPSYRA
jgi:hypothetical protein